MGARAENNRANLEYKLAIVCGVLTALFGVVGALGWVSGWRVLDDIRQMYVPMKPNTSLTFIAMGVALYAVTVHRSSRFTRAWVAVASLLGIVFGGVTVFCLAAHCPFDINDYMFGGLGLRDAGLIGPMSPVTAVCFIVLAFALVSSEWRVGMPPSYPGALVMCSGLVLLIGYWFGTPLLYGGAFVPVALTTSLAFILLGAGFIAAAGRLVWPLNALAGPSARARMLRFMLPSIFALMLLQDWIVSKILGESSVSIVLGCTLTAIAMLLIAYVVVSQVSRAVGNTIDRVTAEREIAQDALRKNNELLQAMGLAQSRFLMGDEAAVVFDELMKAILAQTGSEYGFLGEVICDACGEPSVKALALTNIAWNEETKKLFETLSTGGMVFRNLKTLYGAAVSTGKPVIANQPAADPRRGGLPEGHPRLDSFLGVPFVSGGKVTVVIGVANRPGGYDEAMLESLQPFMATCAQFMEAYRNRQLRQEAEEKYRHLVDNTPDFIYSIDREERFTAANESLCRYFGRPLEEIIGTTQADLGISPKADEEWRKQHRQVLSGEIVRVETEVETPNGVGMFVESVLRPMRDEKGNIIGIRGVWRDITKQRKAEKEKEFLWEQLVHSQKMEAIGILAGGVAHDFNNLLTPIIGYAEMSLRKLHRQDPLHASMERIHEAGTRAKDLTKQLLAYGRKQTLQLNVFRLDSVINNVSGMLRRLIRENIAIEYHLKPEAGCIRADETQVQQIFINLAVNANDAMPAGGKLVIETENVELGDDYCAHHPDVQPGGYVMLAVSDTGHGMDAATLHRIFEPFFTTKKAGEGTGLGLATVYGIVKQHGGSIFVYSEPGQGATFKVYLPRVEEAPALDVPEDAERELRGSESALIVEDEISVRDLARSILEEHGYKVLFSGSPADAILFASSHTEPIDLLLTDVVMPEINGREVQRRITAIHSEIKTLFMSGYTNNIIAHHNVIDDGITFIQKPFTVNSLLGKVRDALDK